MTPTATDKTQKSMEIFRANLREKCRGRQAEVADDADITLTALSRILKGHAVPSLVTAMNLCEALKVDLVEMMREKKFSRAG